METEQQAMCVVSGGCGPLGWAITRELISSGLHVLAIDLPDLVEQRMLESSGMSVSYLPLDLTAPTAAEATRSYVEAASLPLRALINNAAFTGDAKLGGYACSFDEQTDEAFDAALTLNLAVPFRLTRRLTPYLRRAEGSSVVNIASIYGLVGPDLSLYEDTSMGNPAGYAASKGGLIQMTRYLSTVLAPEVRVNCVAPGGLAREQDPLFVRRYEARTPLGRMGEEHEIAEVVGWLVSSASSYVTGQIIAVDGGWTAK